MYILLLVLHIIICIALIGVVLIQSGKGGGLAGGAFGGSAQTVFGGRGATDFVTRATMILGSAFFLTSLVLALMSSGRTGSTRSLIQTEAQRSATSQPATVPGPGSAPTSQAPAPGAVPPATGSAQPAPEAAPTAPPAAGGR